MKKLFIFSLLIVLWAFQLQAQTPHAMKYQTVIRNNAGVALDNKLVAIRASILTTSPNGTMVYQEVHNIATNEFGIANLNIGEGTVLSGIFNNIAWGSTSHFLKIEIDINAGTNFAFMGTSQLLSVPYALYAEKSANAIDDFDKDSTNELQTIQKTGNAVTLSKNGGSFTDSDNQQLSINGNNVSITNGNTIILPADYDKDSTNELQNLSIVGNQLQISKGNSVTITGIVDLDADPTNEIQTISKNGDTISLSKNGGSIIVPNEHTLSSTANGTNRTINITGGTGTTFNIADNDNDSTNELQTITKVGSTITLNKNGGSVTDNDNQNLSLTTIGTQRTINISNGTGITLDVADKDNDSTNELQTLSYSNDTLFLSKGNFVKLPFQEILPVGSCIYSKSGIPPNGFTSSGNYIDIGGSQSWSVSNITNNTAITYNILCNLNDSIFAIKYENNIYKDSLYLFNYSTNNFISIVKLPSDFIIASNQVKIKKSISTTNKIYFFISTTSLSINVYEYNPLTNIFLLKNPFPLLNTTPNNCISVNNKIYCTDLYNHSTSTFLYSMYCYDPNSNSWSQKANLPFINIYNFSLEKNDSIIFLMGGKIINSGDTNIFYRYNINTNQWSQLASMSVNAELPPILYNNNCIYLISGTIFLKYDIITGNWNTISQNVSGGNFLQISVAENKRIYLSNLGGTFQYDIFSNEFKTMPNKNISFDQIEFQFVKDNIIYVFTKGPYSNALGDCVSYIKLPFVNYIHCK